MDWKQGLLAAVVIGACGVAMVLFGCIGVIVLSDGPRPRGFLAILGGAVAIGLLLIGVLMLVIRNQSRS